MAKRVIVPFRTSHLVMTLGEAKKLAENINDELSFLATVEESAIKSPKLTDHGQLSRESMMQFFSQFYEGVQLRNRAGKLFNKLLIVSYRPTSAAFRPPKPLALEVTCPDCHRVMSMEVGTPKDDRCEADEVFHYLKRASYLIDATSVKRCADSFMNEGYLGVGPVMVNDLKLLIRYLP